MRTYALSVMHADCAFSNIVTDDFVYFLRKTDQEKNRDIKTSVFLDYFIS